MASLTMANSISGMGSCGEPTVLRLVGPCAFGHDLEPVAGQRPLQLERYFRWCGEPGLVLFRGGEDHRHGLRMDRPDDAVRLRGEKRVEQMLALNRLCLGAAHARPGPPDACKSGERPVLVQREPH